MRESDRYERKSMEKKPRRGVVDDGVEVVRRGEREREGRTGMWEQKGKRMEVRRGKEKKTRYLEREGGVYFYLPMTM